MSNYGRVPGTYYPTNSDASAHAAAPNGQPGAWSVPTGDISAQHSVPSTQYTESNPSTQYTESFPSVSQLGRVGKRSGNELEGSSRSGERSGNDPRAHIPDKFKAVSSPARDVFHALARENDQLRAHNNMLGSRIQKDMETQRLILERLEALERERDNRMGNDQVYFQHMEAQNNQIERLQNELDTTNERARQGLQEKDALISALQSKAASEHKAMEESVSQAQAEKVVLAAEKKKTEVEQTQQIRQLRIQQRGGPAAQKEPENPPVQDGNALSAAKDSTPSVPDEDVEMETPADKQAAASVSSSISESSSDATTHGNQPPPDATAPPRIRVNLKDVSTEGTPPRLRVDLKAKTKKKATKDVPVPVVPIGVPFLPPMDAVDKDMDMDMEDDAGTATPVTSGKTKVRVAELKSMANEGKSKEALVGLLDLFEGNLHISPVQGSDAGGESEADGVQAKEKRKARRSTRKIIEDNRPRTSDRLSELLLKHRTECDADDLGRARGNVRKMWFATYNLRTHQEWITYQPIEAAEIQGVERKVTEWTGVMRVYFGEAYLHSLWNQAICEHLASETMLNLEEAKLSIGSIGKDVLTLEFWAQLRQSRNVWKAGQPREGEDNVQAKQRALMTQVEHVDKSKLRKRKVDKHARRVQSVKLTIEKKKKMGNKGAAIDLESWELLAQLLEMLDWDGMSSESDGYGSWEGKPRKVFFVKVCVWRNPAVEDYMRVLDDIEPASKGGATRAPRIRDAEKKKKWKGEEWFESQGTHVKPKEELPRSFYNADWLQKEEKANPGYAEGVLRVSEETFRLLENRGKK